MTKVGFIKANLSPGMILNILGRMGAGKTNYATVLIARLVENFYYVFTNILFFDEDEIEEAKSEGLLDKNIEYRKLPEEVKTVTKMSDLLLELNKISRKKKSIVILDESSLFASGVIAREQRVTWLKNFVTSLMRKIGGALVLIAQDKNSIVPMLREELPGTEIWLTYNVKTKVRTEHIYIIPEEYGMTQEPVHIESRVGVPQAIYPYDSNAPAKFEFDLDFDDFMNQIGEFNSLKLRAKLPGIVEKLRDEYRDRLLKDKQKRISKKDLISLMVSNNESLQPSDIKEALERFFGIPVSTNYVSTVRRELLTADF